MKSKMKQGFTLVELLVTLVISAIVMLTIIGLIGYCTNHMKKTQLNIDLQDQAKDAFNHISSYSMEASALEWDDTEKVLTIKKELVDNTGMSKDVEEKIYYYWHIDSNLYFASKEDLAAEAGETDLDAFTPSFTADKNHLMADNVGAIACEIRTPNKNEKIQDHIAKVTLTMQTEDITFDCDREICWRNH